MSRLMQQMKEAALHKDSSVLVDLSSADLTRFTSYRLACAKVFDQVTLIAKILLTEECRRRDGWWSSLFFLHGHPS